MNKLLFFLFLLAIIGSSGCSPKRHLADGNYLFTGAKVKVRSGDKTADTRALKQAYESLIQRPRPNKKFLGIRIGKNPVVYDDKVRLQIEDLLKNKAINSGFFHPDVSSRVKKRGRNAKVKYLVRLKSPYTINTYSNQIQNSTIKEKVDSIQSKSLIKIGELYNLGLLKQERARIAAVFRQNGYYFFKEDDLKFRADTTKENNKVQLELLLKTAVDTNHLIPQRIHNIWIYPDVNLNENNSVALDTSYFEDLIIVSSTQELRPSTLRDAIALKKGQLYSANDHQSSLQRLAALNNHQFIDIQFRPTPGKEGLIKVIIRMTLRKRNAIEGSLGLSLKSNIYLGPEFSLTYLDRNMFKGAEQLRISTTLNFNTPLVDTIVSNQEQELTFSLSKPGLIIPFLRKIRSKNRITSTKIALTYTRERIRIPLIGTEAFLEEEGLTDLLDRLRANPNFSPRLTQNDLNFSLSYQWRKHSLARHELIPIELNLQNPTYEVSQLRDLLLILVNISESSTSTQQLLLNLEQMLILKPSYTYVFDGRARARKANNYYYRAKLAFLSNRLLSDDSFIPSEFLESQFLQVEQDIRHFWKFSERQTIGVRFAAYASIPSEDRAILPFFDLYSIGGPNSVRAFRPRAVGPGSTVPTERIFFFTGTGDILLETSLEWRPKLSKLIELGFFLDAGNVWLFNASVNGNDLAQFKLSNFYKQLAVGTGFGLRFDFDILLLRLDIAFPLNKPWLEEDQRWVADRINFRSSEWRRDNITYNLAFGYPF